MVIFKVILQSSDYLLVLLLH